MRERESGKRGGDSVKRGRGSGRERKELKKVREKERDSGKERRRECVSKNER